MRILAIILTLTIAAPALAEEDRGRDLMNEALRLFMRGLMAEMEPALSDLETLLKNFDTYHPPEVLPNGDIIIRRKRPVDAEDEDKGDIEL
jgi:hypothetical protein